jgi:HSP20 family protein
MAETKTNQAKQGSQSLTRQDREKGEVQRWSPGFGRFEDPSEFMTRMSEELDRTFDRFWRDFGVQPRRSWLPRGLFGWRQQREGWAPRIEAFQKADRFIVRAELPGVKKEDVDVELTDDALTIRGERREEQEEEREGYYRSEREYGQFYRVVPLPEGVIGESAQATFRDGVLEVTMQAAPAETRGRKLEIKETAESGERK